MASPRMRLRGIAGSTRAALKSHPDEARDILRRAEDLLDALHADVRNEGIDNELLWDIEGTRAELTKLADVGGAEEPVAPWETLPYEPGSMGWRMGPGEDIYFEWLAYFDRLSDAEQENYLARHPASGQWKQWAAERRGSIFRSAAEWAATAQADRAATFSAIDEALGPWLDRHGLFVETRHRDDEVRAVTVVDDSGDTYTIGFVPHVGATEIRAQYWPRKHSDRRAWSNVYANAELPNGLEDAYGMVMSWIAERGHSRTPA